MTVLGGGMLGDEEMSKNEKGLTGKDNSVWLQEVGYKEVKR